MVFPVTWLILDANLDSDLDDYTQITCTVMDVQTEEIWFKGLCPGTFNYRIKVTVLTQIPGTTESKHYEACYGGATTCFYGINNATGYVCPSCESSSVNECNR